MGSQSVGGGFNGAIAAPGPEQFAKAAAAQKTEKEMLATGGAFQDLKNSITKKRASQTLFTGGTGVLDSPNTASSILLGI